MVEKMVPMCVIHATNDRLWNHKQLVQFLATNQGRTIELSVNPEAICLETLGIYDLLDCFEFAKVDIYTENPLATHDRYNIKFPARMGRYRWFSHQPYIPPELQHWNGRQIFLGFYHRPSASRLGLASYLFNHYNNHSLIHFNYEAEGDKLDLFEFDKLAHLRVEGLQEVAKILPYMPMLAYHDSDVDEIMSWYDYSRDPGISMYKNIFVDVVSETHVLGNTFYPTEKTVRPMWLKKPFLSYASRDFLCYLRQMGFRTFHDFWDEDYDGYEGRDRYLRLLKVIDDIARRPLHELRDMHDHMRYTLDHNFDLLSRTAYSTQIHEIS